MVFAVASLPPSLKCTVPFPGDGDGKIGIRQASSRAVAFCLDLRLFFHENRKVGNRKIKTARR